MGSEPSARRPSPLRRDPLGPGSGSALQAWAGSGSRPRSGAPAPLQMRGPDCAVRGAPVPGAGAPRATRPAPLASVVCGRSPGVPALGVGRGRRGPLFGHSSLGNSGPWPRPSAPSRARSSGLAARRPPPPVSPPAPPLAPLRPRTCGLGGSALASPLRLARRRLRCGLPLVALPPLRRAFRRRVRPPGPPLRRPLRAVLAAVLVGVGSVGLLRPGALAGPRPPAGGGRGPVCVAFRPGAFALRRWGPRWCCVPLLGLLPIGGFSPSPSPLPLPRWGRGRAPGPAGGKPPKGVRFSRTPLGPPSPLRALPCGGSASPVDFPKIVNRPAAHHCTRAVKGI